MFCLCSRMTDRLPAQWTVHLSDDAYWVEAANGERFAFTYFRRDGLIGTDRGPRVSADLARRIAANIAKLPELLARRRER